MAALGIALNVFGLFAGGIIGIVDLLLPAETPLYISDLAKGHSLLRIGIGLNKDSPQSFGGTVPSIKVFNEEKVQIGQANGDHLTYVENGTFTTVTVYHLCRDSRWRRRRLHCIPRANLGRRSAGRMVG
jgi:hypothetical protein